MSVTSTLWVVALRGTIEVNLARRLATSLEKR
jgi:hypothetical protein